MARTLIIAFLATLAVTLVLANDLNLGGSEPNDHSIKNATVIRKPRVYSQRAIVVFGDGSNITSIRAVDHNVTNNATVSVVRGGLGHRVVVLRFQAPRRRGMNFTVEVKGVRPPRPTPPPKPTTTPSPSSTTEAPAEPTTGSGLPAEPTTGSAPPAESTTGSAPPAEVTTESAPPAESTAAEEEVEENEEEARLLNQVYYANRLL